MSSTKEAKKAHRERAVFELFCRARGWWSLECVVESRPPPQPDVLFRAPGQPPTAFEIVELIDRDYARTSASDAAIKKALDAAFDNLAPPQREDITRRFCDADITISFPYGLTEVQRRTSIEPLFNYLSQLEEGWSGVDLRPAALQPHINEVMVVRGSFKGPLFDVSSAVWVGDPTVEAVSEKVSSSYATPHPICLLAFIESNPMYPNDVWMRDIEAYCRSLSTNPFRDIYVFDVTTRSVLFEWSAPTGPTNDPS